ncbi:MAG: T9SS type A sorting domain-containing protein [Bacteroidia bacterium]
MSTSNYQNKNPLGKLLRIAVCFLVALLLNFNLQAQTTVQIGTGNTFPSNTLYSPVYRFSATSTTTHCRGNILYTAAEMSAAGIPAGATITKIAFNKGNTANFVTPASNYNMLMANTSNTSLASGLAWTSILNTHNQVFQSSSFNIPNTIGWVDWVLTTPFNYTGGALEIAYEMQMTGNGGATDKFLWEYSGTSGSSASLIVGATGSSYPATLTGAVADYKNRPNIQITFTSGPCTVPPTPGSASAAPSSGLCLGNNVVLSLTGNSLGTGQTYQWQESTTIGGPYTNIGASSNSSVLNILASTTKYYQCEVTCSGNSQLSTPVLVTVNPSFPGGNYTINSALPTSGSNFQTFNDFKNALNCGIAGAIVVNVVAGSGPYNEQVEFGEITGVSSVNTITINGNGNVLTYGATVSTAPGTLVLNGTDYMTVNNLTVEGTGTTYALVCHLWNNADNNTFSNCTFNAPVNGTSTSMVPFSISGSATSGTASGNSGINNVITGCTMFSGYYNTAIVGNSSLPSTGNQVINCNILDQYNYATYFLYQNGLVFRGNTLSRPTRTNLSTYYGIYLSTGNTNALVERNKIRNTFATNPTSTSIQYSIYCTIDATLGNENKFSNNVISDINSNGTVYGFYMSGSDYWKAYHNTISLDDASSTATGTTYGFYCTGSLAYDVRNNIVSISRGGTGTKYDVYYSNPSAATSDYNDLYMNASAGTNNIGYNGTAYTTLAAWQSGSGKDANSVSVDPLYVAPGTYDYTPSNGLVNDAGTPVGVTDDINGAPRSLTSPDMGAYEFSLGGLDAGITWFTPTSPSSPGLKTITVNIDNTQAQTINSIQLSYSDGGAPVVQTFTGLGLTSGNNTNLSFTTQYNLVSSVTMTVNILAVNGGADATSGNNTDSYYLCLAPSGTYTINSALPTSGSNFQTFDDAIQALSCGITGPVVFNVVAGSGPYNEQVVIPEISGASSVNTITFNGNGNTLSFNGVVSNPNTLALNGADYITFDSLNIEATNGTYGIACHLYGGADSNTFSKCTFTTSITGTTTVLAALVVNGSATTSTTTGLSGSGNVFSDCEMIGGYYGTVITGLTTSPYNLDNQIINSTIRDFYFYGIYHSYCRNTIVSNNIIERPNRASTSTTYGIYMSTSSYNILVEKNRIRKLFDAIPSSTSTAYCMYNTASGAAGFENKWINNLVYDIESSGALYGLYCPSYNYVHIYHNTISFDDAGATGTTSTYGIYAYGTSTEVKNNIISITRGGTGTKYCLYFGTNTAVASNNNDLYINAPSGSNNIGYSSGAHATFANWQAANGGAWDQNSQSVNPNFANIALENYKPTNVALDNIGAALGVTDDITGALRNMTTPDPGAYEFAAANKDIGVSAFIGPNPDGCFTNAETIVVEIKNFGVQNLDFSIDPVTVNCVITGPVNTTVSATLSSGTLASGATMNVSLAPTVDGTANGTYTLNASTSMTSDGNSSNDAFPAVTLTVGPVAGTASSSVSNLCVSGDPVLSLNGPYGGDIQWQQSTVSATGPWTNVGTNDSTYTPGTVTQSTWYQALTVCNSNTATSNVVAVTVNNPQINSLVPGTRCGYGPVTLGINANMGTTGNWYTNSSGGTPIATGTTYTTPNLNTTTTYYVSPSSGGANGLTIPGDGDWDHVTSSGSYQTTLITGSFMILTVTQPFTLESFDIYPSAALGTAFGIEARTTSASGPMFESYSGNTTVVNSGTPTVAQTVNVNWVLPIGTYYIGFVGTNPNSWRSGSATHSLPWVLPGYASLDYDLTPNYQYYFYNLKISTGCEGVRVPITATVTAPPALSVTTPDPTLCPGGTTTVNVSSINDPSYTYSWTSNPSGFTASGTGPHNVSPTITTQYIVTATDNTVGPNAGCVAVDSVEIVTGATLTAGTVTSSDTAFCVDGIPTLSVTGADGGTIQWQQSTVSASGPWTNVGTDDVVYAPGSVTQTTWYQVMVHCQSSQVYSNVVQVTVNNPQISNSNGDTRCGPGTVTLSATPSSGTVNWFTQPTGGTAIATGNTYSPNISSTTTYYASASTGGGTESAARPTYLTTANTRGNGWGLVFDVVNSPIVLQSVTVYSVTTGGTMSVDLTDNNGVVLQTAGPFTYPAGSVSSPVPVVLPVNFTVPVGTGYRILSASTSGGNLIRETTGISGTWPYTSASSNVVVTSGYISGVTTSTYYWFYDWQVSAGCEGTRVPVVATVNPSPVVNISVQYPTICTGQSATLTATSSNPDYTYNWTPGGSGASIVVAPGTTTTYTLNAIDNTAGPYSQCTAIATQLVSVVSANPPIPIANSGGDVCLGNDIFLSGDNAEPGQMSGNTYFWTGPNSFTSSLQYPSISNPGVTYSGIYNVIVTNQYGCTESASTSLNVNPNPSVTIDSVVNVSCAGGSDGIIYVTASGGLAPYSFTSDFVNFNSTGVMSNLPTGASTVYIADGNACQAQVVGNLTAISTAPPSQSVVVTPTIIGMPAYACAGTTANLSIPAVAGATKYIWDGPFGTFFNGNPMNQSPYTTTTPNVQITFSSSTSSFVSIGVQAANGCGASLRKIQKVRYQISTPKEITGATTMCANTNGTYTIAPVTDATGYQWMITGNATVVPSGTSVTVFFGPSWNGGNLCVAAKTPCYTTAYKCMYISKSASALNAITGPLSSCPNEVQTFSITPCTGAASYNWTLPAGATGSSSTNSITATFGPTFTQGGNICVSVTSICGVTSAPKCRTVAQGLPSVPTSISGITNGLCNQSVNYTVPSSPGVTYNWTAPGTISGNGNSSVNVTYGAFTTGQLCVTASNSCGTSASRCIPLKGSPNSPIGLTAIPASWCANTQGIEFTADLGNTTGSYTLSWGYPSSPTATYVAGGGNSNALTLDWGTGNGSVVVNASNGCGTGSKAFAVTIGCKEGELASANKLNVYPNPTAGVLNVEYTAEKGTAQVTVLDLSGRVVMTQTHANAAGQNTLQLDLSKVAKGAYMLNVQTNGSNNQVRVVVE